MFELPAEDRQSNHLREGVLQPFAHGAISTYLGRRKRRYHSSVWACGRLLGRCRREKHPAGWRGSKQRLEQLETEQKSRSSARLTLSLNLEALHNSSSVHQADGKVEILKQRRGAFTVSDLQPSFAPLKPTQRFVERWPLTAGCSSTTLATSRIGRRRGLASELHEMMASMGGEKLATMGMKGQSHWTLHTGTGRCRPERRNFTGGLDWKDANHARLLLGLHFGRRRRGGRCSWLKCRRVALRDGRGGPMRSFPC